MPKKVKGIIPTIKAKNIRSQSIISMATPNLKLSTKYIKIKTNVQIKRVQINFAPIKIVGGRGETCSKVNHPSTLSMAILFPNLSIATINKIKPLKNIITNSVDSCFTGKNSIREEKSKIPERYKGVRKSCKISKEVCFTKTLI